MKFQLTEKNAAKVMQVINTFFRKDAFEFFKDVERLDFKEKGDFLEPVTIIQDEYTPFIEVKCEKHPMRKKDRDSLSIYDGVPVLLFVRSKYHTRGIPLHVGDVVINKGSRLIIKREERNLKFKDGKHYFQKEWSEQIFVHHPLSEIKRNEAIMDSFNGFISEGLMIDYEGLCLEELDQDCHIEGMSVRDYFNDVEAKVDDLLYHGEFVEKALVFQTDEHKVYLHRNSSNFVENGVEGDSKDSFYYTLCKPNEDLILESKNFYHVVLKLAVPFEEDESEERESYELYDYYESAE